MEQAYLPDNDPLDEDGEEVEAKDPEDGDQQDDVVLPPPPAWAPGAKPNLVRKDFGRWLKDGICESTHPQHMLAVC